MPGASGTGDVSAVSSERGLVHQVLRGLVVLGVLLDHEVGDAGVQVDGSGREDGAEVVVGHHGAVVGLGYGGDLLAVGEPSGKAYVRPHILRTSVGEQLPELPDCVHALTVSQWYGDALGDLALGHDAVDLDGVLVE